MAFIQRTNAPTSGNKYYTKSGYGGYSSCILGNTAYMSAPWSGCTLPNCVGYALGRFNEIGDYKSFKYSGFGNAGDFVNSAKSKGLSTGTVPAVGAMIVWRNGGCGHVAVVEKVISATEILISQSGWSFSSTYFNTANLKKGTDGNWTDGVSWLKGKYSFAGFVYSPVIATPKLDADVVEASPIIQSPVSSPKLPANSQLTFSPNLQASLDAYNKKLLEERKNLINIGERNGLDLLSSSSLIESPFIIAEINGYTFGSYTKNGTFNKANLSASVNFPNYMHSIKIIKTNGTLNQYTLTMEYQIAPGCDPNLLDKVFGTVSDTRKIILSYGDWEVPSFIYKKEEAIITKVTSNMDFSNQKITYILECTSTALAASAVKFDFPAYKSKGSDIIKNILLKDNHYGLLSIFSGMNNKQLVADAGLIPGDDKVVNIEAQHSIDPLAYLNYVVACMSANTNTNQDTQIKDSTYHLIVVDDVENEFGGPYFKVIKVGTSTKTLASTELYDIDVGFPTSTLVTSFNLTTDDSWSILYNYSKEISEKSYKYTINNDGSIRTEEISSASDSIYEIDKTWWTRMTQFPITATLTIKGLLRPAILMTFVRVRTYFYGQKHISSGIYIITRQEDTIDASGYRTTLSLTRIASEDDATYSYSQTTVKADNNIESLKIDATRPGYGYDSNSSKTSRYGSRGAR